MSLKHFILPFAFMLFTLSFSHAALLIEPVGGYNLASDFTIKDKTTNVEKKIGASGVSYGGRLGYQNFGFQVGLDYLKSNLSLDNKVHKNLDASEFAGFVGYRFPILLKVYAGYIFSGTADLKQNNPSLGKVTAKLTGGTGAKAGIAWTLFPFLDFNLEYRRVSYDEMKINGSKQNNDTSYDAYMFSVSIPITI